MPPRAAVRAVPCRRLVGGAPVVAAALLVAGCATTSGKRPCLRQTGCPDPPPLADCANAAHVWNLDDVLSSGDHLLGQVVFVRGPLGRGLYTQTLLRCRPNECCNRGAGFIELSLPRSPNPCVAGDRACSRDDPDHTLLLDGIQCVGDDSTICCPVRADGETVVVRGTLVRARERGAWYRLSGAALCADRR